MYNQNDVMPQKIIIIFKTPLFCNAYIDCLASVVHSQILACSTHTEMVQQLCDICEHECRHVMPLKNTAEVAQRVSKN